MKIAVSGDCFASFTSGFPVRGMMLKLIKNNPDWKFVLYYTSRPWPEKLKNFYSEINSLSNVEVRFFKDSRKRIALKRLLGLKYVTLDCDSDLFLNPGCPEYIRGYNGKSICSLADLSTVKGISTNKYASFFKHWVKFQWNKTLPWTTQIVAISDFTRADIEQFFPKAKDRVVTIHNGISEFWFDNNYSSTFNINEVGIDGEYFIWWGLISERKNTHRLIQAYKLAQAKRPGLPKLLLVGRISDHMSSIKQEFNNSIINIDFQDNSILKLLVKNSKGLIFPSLYEGFGLPVIEAFSQGVNVACSDVSSLPEIAGGHAILFDPLSVDSIATGLLALDEQVPRTQILIEYAKRFNYASAAIQYENLIKRIVL